MTDKAEDLEKNEPEVLTPEQETDAFDEAFNEIADEQPDDKPADDDLDDDPDKDVENADKPAEASADAAADEDDEFKGWPPEAVERYKSQQAQTEKLSHQLKSDNGRVSAFQKKVDGMTKQIEALQAGGGDQPSKEDIAEAMSTDAKWDKFKEDYPDVAGVIDQRFEAQKTEIDNKLNPVIEKVETDSAEKAAAQAEVETTKAYEEVAKEFPSWQNEVQKQEFSDWLATQSPGVHGLAESDDAKDASTLIGLYDGYLVKTGRPTLRKDPESIDNGVEVKTDTLAERRERQLEDGSTIPSKSARVDASSKSDGAFEDAFNAFAARKTSAK